MHIRIGYIYAISMLILNITAFISYRLFGGFGIFHTAALLSLITLLGGVVPVFLRKTKIILADFTFSFMYWSVLGLYAALASKILTRVPGSPFLGMVGIARVLSWFLPVSIFNLERHRW